MLKTSYTSHTYYGKGYQVNAIGVVHNGDFDGIERVLFLDTNTNTETDITDFIYDHSTDAFIEDMEQKCIDNI